MTSTLPQLPPSLDLPPHLSAHKYLLVCSLTVLAWDTLVLSPRTWRLMRTSEWPVLKILFHFLRVFVPIEFAVVAVAFFDTKWSQTSCEKFYLFEPICTAILLAATSAIHVIRIHAIYDRSRAVLLGMGSLFGVQIVVTGVCCAFYRSVPLREGQGCIAGPKHNWVGIYWVAPTLLYTASAILALMRSINSLPTKPLSAWKLMLRDGLNLYGAIWIVNMVNMLFWFIIKPTDEKDTIKTIVTSMAAILTTSMSLRIVLGIRGTLVHGGSFALTGSSAPSNSSRATHVISTRSGIPTNTTPHTYTLDDIRSSKPEAVWGDADSKNASSGDDKGSLPMGNDDRANLGVKVTIDREVGYDSYGHAK
ncbi:hypothetical protein MIND_00857600 [Mycena indigotica]|uniref:DUF6533 domain-containing protein n=1 Tax=Mycena indigotica TaxID=2126181 RepID=A0A8H6SHK4_9AGAR|nr:uncharacterized protein MIND_00857600 [Mycena indigotica]KAF7299093.1 hypothetical protein MIND_00857600 [Mycena indigotica]